MRHRIDSFIAKDILLVPPLELGVIAELRSDEKKKEEKDEKKSDEKKTRKFNILFHLEMGTRVLGLESDSSRDSDGLGLELESSTIELGLGLDSGLARLGLDSDSDLRDSVICSVEN
jgi:hypothetical protein